MTDRKRTIKQRIENLRHGFTMAELLATIAIIGILAGFGFVNVYQHQRNLHLTELDDTAREIFTAAQEHLTIAKSSGKWETFYNKTLRQNNTSEGKEFALGKSMEGEPSDSLIDDWYNKDKHDFHYFAVGDSNTAKELQDIILPNGSIDGTIVPTSTTDSHSIIIEYDARTAVVYGVWYTDGKNGWFGSAKNYHISDRDRTSGRPVKANDGKVYDTTSKAYRRGDDDHSRAQLGYYGGGTNVKPDKYDYSALTTPEAEIVNADKLYAAITPIPSRGNGNSTSGDSKIRTFIQVTGDFSKTSTPRVELNESNTFTQNRNGKTYQCYLLDSTTDGAAGHFATKYNTLIPGEDISVTITNVLGSEEKSTTLHTNSLFDSVSEVAPNDEASLQTGTYVANLKYGRHLQNLSTVASGLGLTGRDKLVVTKANLVQDIDWYKFYNFDDPDGWEERNSANNSHPIGLKSYSPNSLFQGSTGSSALYSIINDNLTQIDGNNHKIENLQIQQENSKTAGLIGKSARSGQNLQIWDLTLTDPSFVSNLTTKNAGFFVGEASSSVSIFNCNVNLTKSQSNQISALENAAVFVGTAGGSDSANGSITIRKANLTTAQGASINLAGHQNAGFLIGSSEWNSVTIDNVTCDLNGTTNITAGNESEGGNAGGLIGQYHGTKQLSLHIINTNLNIKNDTASITATKGNAGGFVGEVDGSEEDTAAGPFNINNSHITFAKDFHVSATGKDENNTIGNAGGLIGRAYWCNPDVNFVNILPEENTRDNAQLEVKAESNGGGIFGFLSTSPSADTAKNQIEDTQYDGGENGLINVKARASGGFIGRLESKGLNINNCATTTYVYTKGSAFGRAGGFIAYVEQKSGTTDISNCYYGGRTKDNGKYGDEPAYFADSTSERPSKGGYNIVNEDSTGKNEKGEYTETATAGGFIGTAQNGNGYDTANSIVITECYTTGSVYEKDTQYGAAGGFVGKAGKDDNGTTSPLKLTNTYATGKVYFPDNRVSKNFAGAFSGLYPINKDSRNNYYLSGVNGSDMQAAGEDPKTENGSGNDTSQEDKRNIYADASKTELIIGVKSVSSSDGPFKAENIEESADPYDTGLGTKYPFKMVSDQHVGDWPIVKEADLSLGILYYERLQSDPSKIYYHGYMVDSDDQNTVTYKNAKYTLEKTNLDKSIDPDQNGLVDKKGEYVSEDGYVLVVKKDNIDLLNNLFMGISGVENFNNAANSGSGLGYSDCNPVSLTNNGLLTQYKNFNLSEVGLPDDEYVVYSFNMNQLLNGGWTYHSEQNGAALLFFRDYSTTDEWKNTYHNYVNKASFSFMPVFAGEIRRPNENGTLPEIGERTADGKRAYQIRSARQLNTLADLDGTGTINSSYLAINGGGSSVVQIGMDITFDPQKVRFTMCGSDGKMDDATDEVHITKDGSGNYLNHTIPSIAPGAVLESSESPNNKEIYSLDGLRNPLVGKNVTEVRNQGTVRNLVITNSNLPYLINGNETSASTISNITVKDSVLNQYGFTYINNGKITDCLIEQSEVKGSTFAENSYGLISNCEANDTLIHHSGLATNIADWNGDINENNILTNVIIEGNGFVDTTTGKFLSNKIINARIGKNGFAGTASGGSIKKCQIYSDQDIYTKALGNEKQLKYFIPDWNLKDLYDYVQIGKDSNGESSNVGGFAGTVSGGAIEDSSVTGNIYSTDNAAGFVHTASGGSISNSYANTVIRATVDAAGFVHDNSNSALSGDHALGILSARNAAGFGFSLSGGSTSKSYTAVWRVNTPTNGQYYSFANAGINVSDSYYLINGYKPSADLNGVTGVTATVLKTESALGSSATKENTVAYGQYMGRLVDQTPYPYPTSAEIKNYGDWYDSDDDNVLFDPVTVQFFDEDGSRLSDKLLVNKGGSVSDKIPTVPIVKGKTFDGWYTEQNGGTPISENAFSVVNADIKAYAHYKIADGYVALNYVNPTTNKASLISIEKIANNAVNEPKDLPKFGGYTRAEKWSSSAATAGTYAVSDGQIQNVESGREIYLRYDKAKTHKITLEIRADNTNQTYPTIYQSYIYEYEEGKKYDIKQSLADFEKSVTNKNGKSAYTLEALTIRNTAESSIGDSLQDVSDGTEAQLDSNNKTVYLSGTADSDKTYVVLYKGETVNYTIEHVFEDSTGPSSGGTYANATYAPGQTYTVTQKLKGSLGEYVDLESKVYQNDGYSVQLNPGSNFVLNEENQQYVINYKRKNYHFTVDTDGANVVEQSPFSVPYGAPIGKTSTYLENEPKTSKPGYSTTGWSYTYTDGNTEGRPNLNAGNATMPAADVTATAQWTENTTAPYMVEVWTQKADSSQTANPQEVGDNYDYYDSFTVNGAAVDRVPDALQNDSSIGSLVLRSLPDSSRTGLSYFNLNPDTAGRNIDSKTKSMKTVQPDGSTVYRVYYDRKEITFNFEFNNISDWQQLYVVRSGNSQSGYTYTVTTNSQGGTALTSNNADYKNGQITYYTNETSRNYPYYQLVGHNVVNRYDVSAISWSNDGLAYNLVYNSAYISNPPTVPPYKGLYGQVLQQEAQNLFGSYKWQYSNSNGSTTTLTMLANYILPGGETDAGSDDTLTLECAGENEGTLQIRHYQETLNGTWRLTTTTKAGSIGNFNLTNKYDGFTVYGFNWGDLSSGTSSVSEDVVINDGQIDKSKNTLNSYNSYRNKPTVLNIFHKRNRPTIQLRNVRSMNGVSLNTDYSVNNNTNITVPYQATLGDIGLPSNLDAKTYMPDGIDRNNDRSDYKFAGWYTSETFAEGTEFNPNATMPNHNIRLYAKWVCDPYQVIYYVGGKKFGEESIERYGTISAKDDQSIREKLQYSPEEGYTFAGWYTDPGLSDDTAYLSSRAVTSSLTLYAKYEKAANTDVTYTVQYLYENDNSRAFEDKVVRTKVGRPYEENPVDIPNAVALDVRSKGLVTSAMDGSKIIFHYRAYKGSNWSYKVEDVVEYTDLNDKKHTVLADLGSHEQTSTYASQNENAAYNESYRTIGDSSQTVAREDDKDKEPIVTFTYEPDYSELKPTNVHVLYGDTSDPGFEGMDKWAKPEGYHFEVTAKYYSQDGSKKKEISKPTDVGTYTVDLELHLKSDSGQDDLLLHELDDVDYRVLKKTVLLTSVDGTWNYDGQEHRDERVNVDPTMGWANNDGFNNEEYDFVDSFIRERGSTRNTFTTLRDKTKEYEKNYNIYRKFGTLTVN